MQTTSNTSGQSLSYDREFDVLYIKFRPVHVSGRDVDSCCVIFRAADGIEGAVIYNFKHFLETDTARIAKYERLLGIPLSQTLLH